MTVYPFIEAEKAAERNVARACALLEVSRSAYYAQRDTPPSPRQLEEAELTAAIARLHEASKGVYGAPKIHDDLKDEGRRHGRKRVARIMREQGLCGKTPKRFKTTTIADPQAAARADLIKRDFTVDAAKINTRWCGDITYIPTWEGWLYLATVIDIASRRVVGFAMADHMRTELVSDALTNALAARDPAPGVIFHSDRGSTGGLNRSSQHLMSTEVVHGTTAAAGRQGPSAGDAVAGQADAGSTRGAGVLAADRAGHEHRGRGRRDRRVDARRLALVSPRWRDATPVPGRADRPLPVVR